MKLLFLTDNFPPEVNAPATRTYEHCREWVKKGVDVTVITCAPNYPQGKLYEGYSNRIRQVEMMSGIKVVRVWSFMTTNKGFVRRTIDYMSFALSATFWGLFEKADVIIATSPQFFTTWSGWLLSKLKRIPWIFELRDLWPESIASVGLFRKEGMAYHLLERIELSLYRSADMVVPNTPAFKRNLVERGIDADKIQVIPNGANFQLFFKNGVPIDLKSRLGITQDFVFGYIGTHGLAHSLDFIVRSIAGNDLDHCHFLFIGDGAEKVEVVALANELGVTNATFLDPVPKTEIPKYMSITDAALVPLKKSDTFKTVIPSKIYEACAMHKPILLGVEGEAKRLIEEYRAGICFEPENEESFVSAVKKMAERGPEYEELSRNALTLAEAFDRNRLAHRMLQKIEHTMKKEMELA